MTHTPTSETTTRQQEAARPAGSVAPPDGQTSTAASTRPRIQPALPTNRGRRQAGPRWLQARTASAVQFTRRRPPLWIEAAVAVWLLWVYDAVNNWSPLRVNTAVGHAASVLRLELTLHFSFEKSLNQFTSTHHLFGLAVSDYYDNAHFIVTLAVLACLWITRPDCYRRWRRALVIINLVAFAVFWLYPMAPPRMLPGFADTVALTHAIGSWHSGGLSADANQYAAMPSLHLAWAAWSAAALWSTVGRPVVRAAAGAHLMVTLFAVLATANHLLIDSAAGVATAGLATIFEPALMPQSDRRWPHGSGGLTAAAGGGPAREPSQMKAVLRCDAHVSMSSDDVRAPSLPPQGGS